MNHRPILAYAALTLSAVFPVIAGEPDAKPPNIILILADDFGYECVTANGGESYRTPNLDRLAAEGMRFEQCHVQPSCTPTRAELMTGKSNIRNYLRFGVLARSETTFANLFRNAGYATGICGKWQLGRQPDSPRHFGFDEACLWQHTRKPPRYANPGLEYDGVEKDFTHGEYGPALVNDFALDFITRHREGPFLLYYPMMLTHNPFQPTPDSPDWDPAAQGEKVNDQGKHFGDMVAYMDKLIGQVEAKLVELGIRDRTLILFLGDNGTRQGVVSRFQGADYKGGKGLTLQRGTHVPLIANWPGVIQPGRVNSDLISGVDFLPTLCEAAGLPAPSALDGVSFMPQLRGEAGTPRSWIYHWYSMRGNPGDVKVTEFASNGRYKLYRTGALYDLVADSEEKKPLAEEALPQEAAGVRSRLQAALDQFADARPADLEEESQRLMMRGVNTTKPGNGTAGGTDGDS